jgi:putative transposase
MSFQPRTSATTRLDLAGALLEKRKTDGFSEASYYLWHSKFGGMSVSDAKRLKELETENTRLEKLLDGRAP